MKTISSRIIVKKLLNRVLIVVSFVIIKFKQTLKMKFAFALLATSVLATQVEVEEPIKVDYTKCKQRLDFLENEVLSYFTILPKIDAEERAILD